jgi:hypothetical protein
MQILETINHPCKNKRSRSFFKFRALYQEEVERVKTGSRTRRPNRVQGLRIIVRLTGLFS